MNRPNFDRTICLGDYHGLLRAAVRTMKLAHQESLITTMGKVLAERVLSSTHLLPFDLIVPIPSHARSRFRRWYNIAELLAQPIASRTRIELKRNLLKYKRDTAKQGTLTRLQRFENLRGSMDCRVSIGVQGRSVLLVDDVLTTSATMSEATRALRAAGVAIVQVAVVARADR